ncbi:hypothetical protein PGT21_032123 [Puccinia graminis f. sp. tritici]|uniref:Uncharacterized protein n=1 Tax=Puccinia graminis f. sp. tritici TaxID=56615 RepID=A0A5B0QQG0_PUCGR|nr:hypothetical protein PGT21_032123 [Puccinia graminis f. sp. tritici]
MFSQVCEADSIRFVFEPDPTAAYFPDEGCLVDLGNPADCDRCCAAASGSMALLG